jgi:hypothetical protein
MSGLRTFSLAVLCQIFEVQLLASMPSIQEKMRSIQCFGFHSSAMRVTQPQESLRPDCMVVKGTRLALLNSEQSLVWYGKIVLWLAEDRNVTLDATPTLVTPNPTFQLPSVSSQRSNGTEELCHFCAQARCRLTSSPRSSYP